jgi:hypothetical protein
MNKFSTHIGSLVALIVCSYVTYYLLLHDNFLHISISAILDSSRQLANKEHLIIVGLIPIYIGTMIFGTALLGVYIGSKVQYHMTKGRLKTKAKSPRVRKNLPRT